MAQSSPPPSKTAQRAGRGGLAVAVGKVYFILVGLVQQIALKAVLGLEGYGALSSALSAASITYNPVVSTSIQGVSRAVAAADESERPLVLRRTWTIHAALSCVVAVAFFACAKPLGGWLGAPHIVTALKLLSAVLVLYGLYTPLVGALNGLQRFFSQASLDVMAATLRTIGLIGGAYWFGRTASETMAEGTSPSTLEEFGGLEGASLGFVVGAFIILIVAILLVGTGQAGGKLPSVRSHLAFIAPLLIGQVLLNLLFQADALLLRRFAADAAVAAGEGALAADPFVGAYRAAQLFCFLPYQLLMSVTFILFPMVARAQAEQDAAAVREFVRQGVRLAFIVAGLLVTVNAGLPRGLIGLVFGQDAARLGGGAMGVLAIGLGALAIFGILTSVLNSLGGARASALVTGLACTLVVAMCFAFVEGTAFGESLLMRTAFATSGGLILATIGAAILVRMRAGGVVRPSTVVRVLLAVAVVTAIGRYLPGEGKVMTLAYSVILSSLYVAFLVFSREIDRADWSRVLSVVRR